MRKIFANFIIIAGLCLIISSIFLVWERYNPNRLKFSGYNANAVTRIDSSNSSLPMFLIIDDLDIDLPVLPSEINNNRWGTTTKGVSYLKSSVKPGDVGNSIIYGHNWKSLLGNLINAKPGQEIKVVNSNGSTESFKIEYVQTVNPGQVSILDQTTDARLTVYTCTGFLDTKRFVVTAIKESIGNLSSD